MVKFFSARFVVTIRLKMLKKPSPSSLSAYVGQFSPCVSIRYRWNGVIVLNSVSLILLIYLEEKTSFKLG